MQLANAPSKLVLAFAASGGKNVVPVDANPTPGGASYTDGFPPLTRTPISGGGIPPSGLDMNGVLYEDTAVTRWLNAGATFEFDQDFADDPNIGGYPAGAVLLQSDGNGLWLNQTDDNVTDPDDAGAAADGWVPGVRYGVAAVTMTNANVTLTPLQYSSPIIVISGLLTTNVQLIFPAIKCQWIVINNTTGAYSITCKTASGAGIAAYGNRLLYSDGTDIKQAATDVIAASLDACASAGGSANAITASFPNLTAQSNINGVPFYVRAATANTTTTPTVTLTGIISGAKTIVKGSNQPLAVGDIAGAGHWLMLQYDSALDKVVLLNPATWNAGSSTGVMALSKNLVITTTGNSSNITISFDECMLELSGGGQYKTVTNFSTVKTTAAWVSGSGNGGLDTGSYAATTWYFVWAIYNQSSVDALISLSATTPTLPSGYTYCALLGAFRSSFVGPNYYPYPIVQKGKKVQNAPAAGTVSPILPLITNGALGSVTVPTWVSVAVSSKVPSIASAISVVLGCPTTGDKCMLATNSNYGAIDDATGNQPPLIASNYPATAIGTLVLESGNIYYAGNGATSVASCLGWEYP